MKKLLILLFILTSCASSFQLNQPPTVDREFTPYVKDFELIVDNPKRTDDLKNLSIVFEDIPDKKDGEYKTLAYCRGMFTNRPIVYVDRNYYNNSSPMSKQFVLIHEMGHCVCNRFHTERSVGYIGLFEDILFKLGLVVKKGYLPDGCPASLMHPYSFSESCMLQHYYYYIEEFKQGCQ